MSDEEDAGEREVTQEVTRKTTSQVQRIVQRKVVYHTINQQKMMSISGSQEQQQQVSNSSSSQQQVFTQSYSSSSKTTSDGRGGNMKSLPFNFPALEGGNPEGTTTMVGSLGQEGTVACAVPSTMLSTRMQGGPQSLGMGMPFPLTQGLDMSSGGPSSTMAMATLGGEEGDGDGSGPRTVMKAMTVFDPENKTVKTGQQISSSNQSSIVGDNSTIHTHTTTSSSYMASFTSDSEETLMSVLNQMKDLETQHAAHGDGYKSLFSNIPFYQDYSDQPALPSTEPHGGFHFGGFPFGKNKRNKKQLAITGGNARPAEDVIEIEEISYTPEALIREIPESKVTPVPPTVKKPVDTKTPNGGQKPNEVWANRLAGSGPSRTSWSEMQEVTEANLHKKLSKKEIRLQESLFEIITSEASYYRSVSVLVNHFYKAKEFDCTDSTSQAVVNPMEKHHLFSNILLIHMVSEKFLNDLESRWRQQCPVLTELCDVALKHAETNFEPYVTYLRNQSYQNEALQKLKDQEGFRTAVERLQSSPSCGKLHLDTFLMLPMQRITRLRLLIDAALKIMDDIPTIQEEKKATARQAVVAIKKLLSASESEKFLMDQKSRLMTICNSLDFSTNCKRIGISEKELIKEGELKGVSDTKSSSVLKKFSSKKPQKLYLILFNDLLLITKKKNNRYQVLDYCPRSALSVAPVRGSLAGSISIAAELSTSGMTTSHSSHSLTNQLASSNSNGIPEAASEHPTMFSLQLLKSHSGIFSEVIIVCVDRSERDSWYQVLSPPHVPQKVDEITYEDNDSPQVVATRPHEAQKPGELTVQPGELISVKKKAATGYYLGINARGVSGWFPCDIVLEVVSNHVIKRLWSKFSEGAKLEDVMIQGPPTSKSKAPTTTNCRTNQAVNKGHISNSTLI